MLPHNPQITQITQIYKSVKNGTVGLCSVTVVFLRPRTVDGNQGADGNNELTIWRHSLIGFYLLLGFCVLYLA